MHADVRTFAVQDETYFRDSYKGCRKGTMPRPARKSGRKAAKRGLRKQQVCVVTGIDDVGASFLVVSGRGMLGKERAYKVLNGRIGKGALVTTDKVGAYPRSTRPARKAHLGLHAPCHIPSPFSGTHYDDHAWEWCRAARYAVHLETESAFDESDLRSVENILLEPSGIRSGWEQHNDNGVLSAGLHTAFAYPLRDCSAVWRIAEYRLPPPFMVKCAVFSGKVFWAFVVRFTACRVQCEMELAIQLCE